MWVTLTLKSENSKTGPIPVTITERESCPKECPLKDTDCYARFSYLGILWNKVSNRKIGDNWSAFCQRLKKFREGQLWRHNQAGDLPKNSKGKIHATKIRELIRAARHTKMWTYTHYDPTNSHNAKLIRELNESGLTTNLSADSLTQADEYAKLNIGPVVVTLPSDAPHMGNKTPNGLTIVVCPAQTGDITCADCKLCQKQRKSVVGFLAHGTAGKRLTKRLTTASAVVD